MENAERKQRRIVVVGRRKGPYADFAHALVYAAVAGAMRRHSNVERHYAAQFLYTRRLWFRCIYRWKMSGMLASFLYKRLRFCRTSGFVLNVARSKFKCRHALCPFCAFESTFELANRCASWLSQKSLDVVEIPLPYTSRELVNVSPCSQIVVDVKQLRKSIAVSVPGASGFSTMRIAAQNASVFGPPRFVPSLFAVGVGLTEVRLREPWKMQVATDTPRNALYRALAYRRGWLRLSYDEAIMISEWKKLIRLSWFGSMRRKEKKFTHTECL